MFCEHCGSQIPDGSKFCTECGTPVPQAPEPQETVSAPRQPSPSAEPAWTPPPQQNAWQQPDQTTRPPENAWQQPAGNSFGYSTVGGGDGQSAPRPAAASGQVSWDPERASGGSKPVTKQWWFWLIIVLAAAAVLAAALFFLFKARKTEAPELTTGTGDIRTGLAEVGSAAAAPKDEPVTVTPGNDAPVFSEPKDDIPEVGEPKDELPAPDDAGTQNIDPAVQALADEVDAYLSEEGILHTVEADEDDWIFVYIWYDGVDELTDRAGIDGDEDALAKWADDIEYMRGLSADIRTSLDAIEEDIGGAVVGIQSDVDEDIVIAYAFDGEVVYDWVNDIDLLSDLT